MTEEDHLLIILAEECAEVAHRASKALRFGLEEVQPGECRHNRERIELELADLLGVAEMLGLQVDPDLMEAKKHRVREFLEYSRKLGRCE